MARVFMAIASVLGALSVIGGAFGAHALKDKLTEGALGSFETGIRYQMYHAIVLLFVAIAIAMYPNVKAFVIAGWCFIAGIILFSGSLYGLSLGKITALGLVTPLGGLAFIVGWGFLVWASRAAF